MTTPSSLSSPRASTSDLGIVGVSALHRFCHSLEGNRRFLVDRLDFEEIAVSSAELENRTRQRSALFRAGDCAVVCAEPIGEGPAARYLRRHPEGIGGIAFEVEDVKHTLAVLDSRGGTPTTDVLRFSSDEDLGIFAITTPLDDVLFYFVERGDKAQCPLPGFDRHSAHTGGKNTFGFGAYDHITSNFQTMSPALLWFEHVMGFDRYWDIEFHTQDAGAVDTGSGLRSVVMHDANSGIKFANNEPVRPNFNESQVALFCVDQRGNGVQHAAMSIEDLVDAVPALHERGVRFVKTPAPYYDALQERLVREGVGEIDEDVETLRALDILVDGEGKGRYLLQIFMEDAARFEGDPKRSPFFFELIQRKGDRGFGAGNFRALFEGVERAQQSRVPRS